MKYLNIVFFLISFDALSGLGELRRADEIAMRENRSINDTYREVLRHDRDLIERHGERRNRKPSKPKPRKITPEARVSRALRKAKKISKLNYEAPVQVIENFSPEKIDGKPVIIKHSEIYLKIESRWVKVDETFSTQNPKKFKIDFFGTKKKVEEIKEELPPHHPIFERNDREFKSLKQMTSNIKRKAKKFERVVSRKKAPSKFAQIKYLEARFIKFIPNTEREEVLRTLVTKFTGRAGSRLNWEEKFPHEQTLEIVKGLEGILNGEEGKGLSKDISELFLGKRLKSGKELTKEDQINLGMNIIYYGFNTISLRGAYVFLANLEYRLGIPGIGRVTREVIEKIGENFNGTSFFKDYKFKGPQDKIRYENERLFKELYLQEAHTKERERIKSLGVQSIIASDEFHFGGHTEEAEKTQGIAKEILDILLGITPVVSIGKDLYESIFGLNFVTQDKLDKWDRSFAVMGFLSLGFSNYIKAPLKLSKKLFGKLSKKFISLSPMGLKTIRERVSDIFKSAKELGIRLKNDMRRFVDYLSEEPGRLYDLEYVIRKTKSSANEAGNFLNKNVYKGTFENKTKSVIYHTIKHGKDRSPKEYIKDALVFYKKNKNVGKEVILNDGSAGILIKTKKKLTNGKVKKIGGYFTKDGKVVTYWD